MRGAGKQTHYEYEVRIALPDGKLNILRRYSRFRELHLCMKHCYGAKVSWLLFLLNIPCFNLCYFHCRSPLYPFHAVSSSPRIANLWPNIDDVCLSSTCVACLLSARKFHNVPSMTGPGGRASREPLSSSCRLFSRKASSRTESMGRDNS